MSKEQNIKDEIVTEIKSALEDQPLNVLQEFLAFVKGLVAGDTPAAGDHCCRPRDRK